MSDVTGQKPIEPRRRLWPRVLLVVSLTLNVLVLSVIAGAHVREGRDIRDGRRPPPSPDRTVLRDGGFMPFFDAMPREARDRMTAALREQEGGGMPDRAALAASRSGVSPACGRSAPVPTTRGGSVGQVRRGGVRTPSAPPRLCARIFR